MKPHHVSTHAGAFNQQASMDGIEHHRTVNCESVSAVDPETSHTSLGIVVSAPIKTPNGRKSQRTVYTKTGDLGWCSLLSGERVLKDGDQIEASGNIDELNSVLGVLVSLLPENALWLSKGMERIQRALFKIGALVASDPHSALADRLTALSAEDIHWLEWSIDAMEDRLPAMERFIIPGGHPSAAYAHLARSVCRRTERQVIRAFRNISPKERPEPVAHALAFLNRLSDFLFVLGRWFNSLHEVQEKVLERNLKGVGSCPQNG